MNNLIKTPELSIGFFCTSTSFGGLEMNIVRMAKWMSERGHNVYLFCLEKSKIDDFAKKSDIRSVYVNEPTKYFAIRAGLKIRKLLKKYAIRLLLFRHNKDLSALVFAKVLSLNSFKLIYHQGMQIGVRKKDIFHTLKFRKIDAWISTLSDMAEEVEHKTRMPSRRIHVVPLGLDLSRVLQPNSNAVNLKSELKLKESAILIGMLGRFSPQKGQLFVLKAITELLRENRDYHVVLAGEPTLNKAGEEYYQDVVSYIRMNQLDKQVTLYGFTDDVYSFYNSIDLFIMASEKETYGLVTIEALVSGVRIIASDSGGTKSLMENGRYGYLFNPFDEQELIHAMKNALNSESLAKKYKEEIHAKFDHIRQCEKMEEIFVEL